MNLKFLALFLLFGFQLTTLSAQYTEVINTNRPGGSEGAFAVGRDVLQFETGFQYKKEEHKLLDTEMTGFGIDYSIRYGLMAEQLELKWMGEYHSDNILYNAYTPAKEDKISNFKSNVVGAKYLVYDPHIKRDLAGPNLYSWRANNKFQWRDLIPAVSVFVGVHLDFDTENPYLPPGTNVLSPKVLISTQNNFKGGWVFVTNIMGERVTTDYPSYSYILTLTHTFNSFFSFFIENQGIMSDFYADQLVRGGAAALITKDLQVDLSLGYSFKDTPSILYGRLGLAYRFDFHKTDDFLEEMDPKKRKEERLERKAKKEEKKKKAEDPLNDPDPIQWNFNDDDK